MQQIVGQLIFDGAETVSTAALPEADSAALKARMLSELGADCAAWMQTGGKI